MCVFSGEVSLQLRVFFVGGILGLNWSNANPLELRAQSCGSLCHRKHVSVLLL